MFKNGEKIKEFLIKMRIGKGGMGTIYYAIDTTLDREVALKEIHPQYSDNATLMERFKIEAMTQAKMNHPNIVTVYSFINVEDKKLIVMEYVKGKSLKELMESKGVLSVPTAINYMKQVLDALKYAHKQNIIHRDIKPGNILIDEDNKVKISDFGIAKIFGAESITKTGMLIGTPWYTSPEQILGEELDFRSDLYSAGVTFYEMLTRKLPFQTDTNSDFQIQQAHLETPPIRPSIFNSEIGSRVEKFILKALAKKKKKRYQSADEMIEELQAIEGNIAKVTSIEVGPGTEISQIKRKKSGSKKGLVLGLIFTVFIIAAFSVYYFILNPDLNKDKKTPDNQQAAVMYEDGQSGQKNINKEESTDLIDQQKTSEEVSSPKDDSKSSEAVDPVKDKKEQDSIPKESPKVKKESQKSNEVLSTKDKNTNPAVNKKSTSPPKNDVKASPRINSKNESKKTQIKDPQVRDNKQQIKEKSDNPPDPDTKKNVLNLEEDVFYIRSEIAKRSFETAEERVNKLLTIKRSPRLLHLAGKIKFFKGELDETLELWKEAVEIGGEITLPVFHRQGRCNGYLHLKSNLIRFVTRTAGYSFALSKSRFVEIAHHSKGIQFTGNYGNGEQKSVLNIRAQRDLARKERFLIYFIKNHIMVD